LIFQSFSMSSGMSTQRKCLVQGLKADVSERDFCNYVARYHPRNVIFKQCPVTRGRTGQVILTFDSEQQAKQATSSLHGVKIGHSVLSACGSLGPTYGSSTTGSLVQEQARKQAQAQAMQNLLFYGGQNMPFGGMQSALATYAMYAMALQQAASATASAGTSSTSSVSPSTRPTETAPPARDIPPHFAVREAQQAVPSFAGFPIPIPMAMNLPTFQGGMMPVGFPYQAPIHQAQAAPPRQTSPPAEVQEQGQSPSPPPPSPPPPPQPVPPSFHARKSSAKVAIPDLLDVDLEEQEAIDYLPLCPTKVGAPDPAELPPLYFDDESDTDTVSKDSSSTDSEVAELSPERDTDEPSSANVAALQATVTAKLDVANASAGAARGVNEAIHIELCKVIDERDGPAEERGHYEAIVRAIMAMPTKEQLRCLFEPEVLEGKITSYFHFRSAFPVGDSEGVLVGHHRDEKGLHAAVRTETIALTPA